MKENLLKVHDIYKKHVHAPVIKFDLDYLKKREVKVELLRCGCGHWMYAVVQYGQPEVLDFDENDSDEFLILAINKTRSLPGNLGKEFQGFIKGRCDVNKERWNKLGGDK